MILRLFAAPWCSRTAGGVLSTTASWRLVLHTCEMRFECLCMSVIVLVGNFGSRLDWCYEDEGLSCRWHDNERTHMHTKFHHAPAHTVTKHGIPLAGQRYHGTGRFVLISLHRQEDLARLLQVRLSKLKCYFWSYLHASLCAFCVCFAQPHAWSFGFIRIRNPKRGADQPE